MEYIRVLEQMIHTLKSGGGKVVYLSYELDGCVEQWGQMALEDLLLLEQDGCPVLLDSMRRGRGFKVVVD